MFLMDFCPNFSAVTSDSVAGPRSLDAGYDPGGHHYHRYNVKETTEGPRKGVNRRVPWKGLLNCLTFICNKIYSCLVIMQFNREKQNLKQRRINFDATELRCIKVDTGLFKHFNIIDSKLFRHRVTDGNILFRPS